MLDQASEFVEDYRRNGFMSGLTVFSAENVAELRQAIETLAAEHAEGAGGYDLGQFFRVNGHVVLPVLAEFWRRSCSRNLLFSAFKAPSFSFCCLI